MRLAANPFGVPGNGDDGGASSGNVLPRPEPAELIVGQDGDAGPADEDSRQAGSWRFVQFLEGIGEEEHLNSLSSVVAAFFERAKPTGFTGTDFHFAKSIGSDLQRSRVCSGRGMVKGGI
jgi:hypothetical protein